MNDSIVEAYLNHQVNIGKVKFGWNDDITNYHYTRFFNQTDDDVMIECQYEDNGKVFSKHLTSKMSDILQFVRDNKLNELGI